MSIDNAKFINTHQSSVGEISIIGITRLNRPEGLRKPYDYLCPRKKMDRHYQMLWEFINKQAKALKFQYCSVFKKRLLKGIKIDLFILGYCPGFCGDDTGVTEHEWNSVVGQIQKMLHSWLGEDAQMYIGKYTLNEKFQARFETYIAYKEEIQQLKFKK